MKNMKKYTIKNYKGNIVESLSRFAKSHKGMKIVEAAEEKDELKIKAEEYSDFRDKLVDKYYDNAKKLADEVLQEFYNGFKNYFEIEDEQGYSIHGDFHDGYNDIIELFNNISNVVIKLGKYSWTSSWEEVYDNTFKPFKQKLDELKKLINQASEEYKEYKK